MISSSRAYIAGENSESVPLVSVGMPSRETARGFCLGMKSFTCSSWEWKWTPLWASVAGALLEEPELIGSVIIVRDPWEGVPLVLSDDLRGSPDFFLNNGGVRTLCATTAAGRVRTCGSDKGRDIFPAVLGRYVDEVSLKSASVDGVVGVEVEFELGGVAVAGKLARVKITPEDGGSITEETELGARRELGTDACLLGTQGMGEVEELRER